MKKVIINADDFGYSSGVNQGIITAFQNGILSSTTLMANMPGCSEAIKLARENPKLGVGGHLVLTCGKPLLNHVRLVTKEGYFYHLADYPEARKNMLPEAIYEEWSAQITRLLTSGVNLTHLDSHHHVHTFPENAEIVQALAEKYQLPFRNAFGLEDRLSLPCQKGIRGFADLMNHPAIRNMEKPYNAQKQACFQDIQKVLDTLTEEITELMVHPAFIDEALYFDSSFNIQRMREVELLTDPQLKTLFQNNGIDIIHY